MLDHAIETFEEINVLATRVSYSTSQLINYSYVEWPRITGFGSHACIRIPSETLKPAFHGVFI